MSSSAQVVLQFSNVICILQQHVHHAVVNGLISLCLPDTQQHVYVGSLWQDNIRMCLDSHKAASYM